MLGYDGKKKLPDIWGTCWFKWYAISLQQFKLLDSVVNSFHFSYNIELVQKSKFSNVLKPCLLEIFENIFLKRYIYIYGELVVIM